MGRIDWHSREGARLAGGKLAALSMLAFPSIAAAAPGAVSPNGGWIAFQSDRTGVAAVYRMRSDGSHERRLVNAPNFEPGPVFSPNGRKIAFVSAPGGPPDVYTMRANGSHVRRITTGKGFDAFPAWQTR